MSIGQKINQLRKDNNMTQQQLAKQLNVTRQTISKWENDLSLPDMDIMLKICNDFHVPLHEFLGVKSEQVDEVTLSDIYAQITVYQDHLKQDNKKKNYLNIILMILVVISLVLSSFMYVKVKRYDDILDAYNTFHDNLGIRNDWMTNYIDENDIFINDSSKTYMETVLCDLTHETIELKYQFTLTKYNSHTAISIEFKDNSQKKSHYTLNKIEENVFEFHETIPLENYETSLTIDNGAGEKTNVLLKYTNYLTYYVSKLVHIYIPVKNGKLQTKKIVYQPQKRQDMTGELNKGYLYMIITDKSSDFTISRQIELNKKQEYELYDDIPLDRKICVEIIYRYQSKNGNSGLSYWLTQVPGEMVVPSTNNEYVIF